MDSDHDDAERGEALRRRLGVHGVRLEPVGNGIARVSWPTDLHDQPFEVAAATVRAEVELALTDLKQARVEAHVDPDDAVAGRIATWSGLRREGVMRGAVAESGERRDRVVYARVSGDEPIHQGQGFRALLNSFLPRKRAIAQMLVRDPAGRVLLCRLTYKQDWDLPGGVVEVGESPRLAVAREVTEELALDLPAGELLLTDWLPAWSGWDDALCLVFDGGVHDPAILGRVVPQAREIREVAFCNAAEVEQRCADFTARRIAAALRRTTDDGDEAGTSYTESGHPPQL